jgi:hypothetical protein
LIFYTVSTQDLKWCKNIVCGVSKFKSIWAVAAPAVSALRVPPVLDLFNANDDDKEYDL